MFVSMLDSELHCFAIPGCSFFWILFSGSWILVSVLWLMDSGLWILVSGFWMLQFQCVKCIITYGKQHVTNRSQYIITHGACVTWKQNLLIKKGLNKNNNGRELFNTSSPKGNQSEIFHLRSM